MPTSLTCADIPVRVIALSDAKFDAAQKRISAAAGQLTDVKRWPAVRGADFFDKNRRLLPEYREIAKEKYPYLQLPEEPISMLSTQTETLLPGGIRTNMYDLHNPGAVGCALSHISIWQHIVANNIAAMVVLEDDVEFENRFVNKKLSFCNELNRILNAFSFNFDVLNFNLAKIPRPFVDATVTARTQLADVVQVKGIAFRAQGYVITRKGAQAMLTNVFPLLRVIDAHMTGLTVLPSTEKTVFYLATNTPWLKHDFIDLNNSQIGYAAMHILNDSLFFVPRAFLLATIGFAIISFVFIVVLVIIAMRLKIQIDKTSSFATTMQTTKKEKRVRIKPY